MSMFEKITPAEKTMFDYYRFDDEEIAKASHQEGREEKIADAETILRYWSANKVKLFNLLGKELIISKEIRIAKDETAIRHDIDERLRMHTDYALPFLTNFENALRGKRLFKEEPDFPYQEDYWTVQSWLLSTDALMNNRVNRSKYDTRDTIIFPSGHTVKVTDGTRPLRVLKKIADEFNIEGFEEFRLEHSRILNDKYMTGKLCLSIHPLDYMTMSDNANNWSSCMSWRRQGAYRSGTVEMMNSPYVVVAYLSSDTNTMTIGTDKWNSKKWRELFIVHENCICGIKGYPYQSYTLEEMCLNWLTELASKNLGWEYKDELDTYDEGSAYCRSIRFETYQMYNDTECNLCTIRYAKYWDTTRTKSFWINYSGETECMVCGTAYEADIEEDYDMLVCDYCSPYRYCDECGFRTYADNLIEYNGMMYCQGCMDNFPICPSCDEIILPADEAPRILVIKNGVFRWSAELVCCKDCYEADQLFNKEDVFDVLVDTTSEWGYPTREKVIYFEDLTDLGKEAYYKLPRAYDYERNVQEYSEELIANKPADQWITYYLIEGKDYGDANIRALRTLQD